MARLFRLYLLAFFLVVVFSTLASNQTIRAGSRLSSWRTRFRRRFEQRWPILPRRLPAETTLSGRMVDQLDDQDVAFPVCLALELLADRDALDKFTLLAVGGMNGLFDGRDRDVVHR